MNKRNLTGFWMGYTVVITVITVVFVIGTCLLGAFHPALQGSLMVAMGLSIVFINFPMSKRHLAEEQSKSCALLVYGTKNYPSVLDILLTVMGVVPCLIISLFWETFVLMPFSFETYHLYLGGILFFVLLEATRRTIGIMVPILVGVFTAYMLLGHHIPGEWGHAHYPVYELFYVFYLTTEGVWGVLTDMVSRLVAIFILLGPVLFATGLGSFFIKLSRFIGGRIRGGAAQIAVIASSFLGMITGATVANVATTGTFTIPTMKKFGYKPEIAGGTEAAASCSGQILPPIMGAGAFIMAELVGISYASVVKAAIIPSICFVFGIAAGVYCLAGRNGLGKLPTRLIPKAEELSNLKEILGTVVPIGLLVYLLITYVQPEKCGAIAMISAIAIFLFYGSWKPSVIWPRVKGILKAFYSGVNGSLVMLVVMMSCVQVVVTIINATGFGIMISQFIMEIAGGIKIYALFGVMIVAIVLGMGMSTTAAYVVAAAALMPIMKSLDLPLLATHLFIFYFAIAAAITPPVCVAVFTARAISGGSWLRVAVYAMGLSLGGYIVPYFFIFQPAILMEGTVMESLRVLIGCMVAMFFIEAATFGHIKRPTTVLERFLFFGGGLLLMSSSLMTDFIGFVLVGIGLLSHFFLPVSPIPLICKRAEQAPLVEMDKLDVDQEEVKHFLDESGRNIAESEDAVG
ncbi:MAG: TRAP transporter fused permease subunit [Deltaproteobacteria bacterium]|nr:TRAP transporter fused permease subunit [Deltaproteobacteria bacterium]